MRVKCQQCQRTYLITDDRVTRKRINLHCKHCGHTFENPKASKENKEIHEALKKLKKERLETEVIKKCIWYVAVDGNADGPFSTKEIQVLYHQHKITDTTMLWQRSWPIWRAFEEVAELTADLSQVTPNTESDLNLPPLGIYQPSKSTKPSTQPTNNQPELTQITRGVNDLRQRLLACPQEEATPAKTNHHKITEKLQAEKSFAPMIDSDMPLLPSTDDMVTDVIATVERSDD